MHEVDLERVICRVADICDRGALGFTLGTGDWPLHGLVTRQGDRVWAYVNRCPHAGHPLDLRPNDFMTLDRTLLLCHSHGASFEPATGYCVIGPCAGQSLLHVPIVVESGYVLLAEGVDPSALAPD